MIFSIVFQHNFRNEAHLPHPSFTRVQVTDGSHASSAPVYDSRRFESRREQEFVNGQPVYDLHHERLYKVSVIVGEP